MSQTTLKGNKAERIASQYLSKKGFQTLGQNYHCKYGEIDLIVRKDEVLVFVEVKYRKSAKFGYPYEAVTRNKLKKIKLTIDHYLSNHSHQPEYRIDVISILGALDSPRITHFQNITSS